MKTSPETCPQLKGQSPAALADSETKSETVLGPGHCGICMEYGKMSQCWNSWPLMNEANRSETLRATAKSSIAFVKWGEEWCWGLNPI